MYIPEVGISTKNRSDFPHYPIPIDYPLQNCSNTAFNGWTSGACALNDETHYQLLKLIEGNPQLSQRELANAMGVSLGKINYCLRAVMQRGLVKVKNFKANPNKRMYAYYLTPKGVEEKSRVTVQFLKRKMREYENLKREIELLQIEIATSESKEHVV